ncbi:mitoferrin-1-like [Hydractinia symbiolongicarpus]|uniref:mitoferrin-1-like n=1 Tax=Hydractinia symbiolongicarpus TaxID=13093 RepID=UPI00254ED4B9|nr:mitoferrin-1-like [Hydractinia symbiolongicarpus]
MSRQKHIDIPSVPYEDHIKININQQPLTGASVVSSVDQSAIEKLTETAKMLDESSKQAHIYIMAGAAAGIMEHCVMYPVDSVKTRMQSLRPHPKAAYTSIRQAFSQIIKSEGLMRPIRGINIVALGAGPSHAMYFGSYEFMKKMLGKKELNSQSPLVNAISGSVATVFHDGTMNPVEVVKQRIQMYNSPYRGVYHCASSILKNEGITAFYRSFTTTLTMNIPFQCIHFVTYEHMRELLNPEGGYNPRTHLLAGATAGGLAAAVTTPLDVAKTLLNTQEKSVVLEKTIKRSKSGKHNAYFVRGMFNAMGTIYKVRGFGGYFRGLRARVIYQVPSCAISWSVYEFFKHYLSLKISDEEMMDLTV